MTFVVSIIIAVLFAKLTGISIEYRLMAIAIILAGGLAGLGRD